MRGLRLYERALHHQGSTRALSIRGLSLYERALDERAKAVTAHERAWAKAKALTAQLTPLRLRL